MQLKKIMLTLSIVGLLLFSAIGAGTILIPTFTEKQTITANDVPVTADYVIKETENKDDMGSGDDTIGSSAVIFSSGFEGTPFDVDFAVNTGWLDTYYGVPHTGEHHAYSWGSGDTLITPSLLFGDNTELTFWHAAESGSNPMTLEVYIDDNSTQSNLLWEHTFTNVDYRNVTVDLSMYSGNHQILFIAYTSDIYGQCLDDITITSEFDTEEPVITNIDAYPDPQIVDDFVNITCTVIDDTGVDEVFVHITYPDVSEENLSISANNIGSTYYLYQNYSQIGTYSYFIWANDTEDNRAISSIFSFEIIDELELPRVVVEKTVWDGEEFSEYAEVYEDEIVTFNVSIYNPYEDYEIHWSGNILETLPCNLRYIPGSTTLPLESHSELEEEIIDEENNTVLWQVHKLAYIRPGDYLNFTYQATAVCCGDEPLDNEVLVRPSTLVYRGVGGGEDITSANYDMELIYGSDTASVLVFCLPDVTVIKYGKSVDDTSWSDSITAHINTSIVHFKIEVLIEDGVFDWVSISDVLPSFLFFNGTYSISEGCYDVTFTHDGQYLNWNFTMIGEVEGSHLCTIYYDAEILDCGVGPNQIMTTALYDEFLMIPVTDPVDILIFGCESITLTKLVKPDCEDELFDDHIIFDYGEYDYVTYMIDVYVSELTHELIIRDTLPQIDGFEYMTGWIENEEGFNIPNSGYLNGYHYWASFEQSMNESYIFWNFTGVNPGTHFVIMYCVTVNGCDIKENTVNASALIQPCCPEGWVYAEDSAIVEIICPSDVILEKKVSYDGVTWVDDEIDASVGDILWFKLFIKNLAFDEAHNLVITDNLPDHLVLEAVIDANGAADHSIDDQHLKWFIAVLDGLEAHEIIYTARVTGIGSDHNIACVEVDCDENATWCDEVIVDVTDGIHLDKRVAITDDGPWVEQVSLEPGDVAWWNISIDYLTFDSSTPLLFDIVVNDILPEGLSYKDDTGKVMTSEGWTLMLDPVIDGQNLTWNLSAYNDCSLSNNSWLSVIFATDIASDATGVLVNWAEVTAKQCTNTTVFARDNATLFSGCTSEYLDCVKLVREDPGDAWVDEIDTDLDEIIEFKIMITNKGIGAMNHISIEDDLPAGLEFVDGSAQILFDGDYYDCDPDFTIDDTIVWQDICMCLPTGDPGVLARYLLVNETVSLIFEAETIAAGRSVNTVRVDALMCDGVVPVSCMDTAIVNVDVDPLIIDAGGPYTGIVDEVITFTASASGGVSPYSYAWDLDDDGEFDDATVKSPTKTWSNPGTYTVAVEVTDDEGTSKNDTATVTISEPADPEADLYCSGTLTWTDSNPGETVTGTFTIRNTGDAGSLLDWSIDSFPTWGSWSFSPSEGNDMTPADGSIAVTVTVTIPDEKNSDFDGTIVVVNDENSLDSEEIMITLSTTKTSEHPFLDFLERVLERFPLFSSLLSFLL